MVLSVARTVHFPVAAAGAIRMENSFGEIDVEGWDHPEVEVTVVRSSEHELDPKKRTEMEQRLNSVTVDAKQEGNDVVISTGYPARNVFLHPLSRRSDVEIRYEIHAPRGSNLQIDDNRGGVNVSGIHGAIQTTVINGQITLSLAPDTYSIDARPGLGKIYSDFEGTARPQRWIGEDFATGTASPATKLYLRTRVGDIVILKRNGPAD